MSTVVPSTRSRRPRVVPARVLVVEDHPLLRSVIRIACEQAQSLEVVAETEDGATALEICRRDRPDVMVLDLSLVGETQGLEVARIVRAEGLPVKILVLTARTDDEAVYESLAAGVDGYLEKTAGVRSIADALERIAHGERIFTPVQMRGAITELGRRAKQAREVTSAKASVSVRELEILELAASGRTVGQIARRLSLSPRTVETHLTNAYRKLGVRNRVQAIARASGLGLIEIDPPSNGTTEIEPAERRG